MDASSFMGRMGVYGVSIFFILSGLSMAIVYNNAIKTKKQVISFIAKRLFRIIPLLFLVTTLTLAFSIYFKGAHLDITKYLLNISTLFGIFDYSSYIATGAWSIGNEMVYYLLTPLYLIAFDKNKLLGNVLFGISVLIGLYFSCYLLDPTATIQSQWKIYINPFNNLFLYTAGIAIFYNLKNIRISYSIPLILLGTLLLIFYPITGNSILLVTGFTRIIFCIISIIIVIAFYKISFKLPKAPAYMLETFGIATYGVYMYHPVLYKYLSLFSAITSNKNLYFLLTVVCTIILSVFSYYKFEILFSNWGKLFLKKTLK